MNPISVLSVLVKAQGIAETNAQLGELQAKAARVAASAGEAEAMTGRMGRAGRGAAAGMSAAAAAAQKGESAFGKFSARGSLGLGRLRAYGPVAAIAGAAAVGMGVQFNDAMQKIVALVGVSQKQVDAWKKDLMALGPQVGKSPKELADALYFLTSSGLSGSDAMSALRVSAKASAAGLGDMTKIADAISSAMNAYGAKTMTAARATDILVATAKAGKAEPEELAATMGRVLPIASQMGVTFKDVGGAVASMSLKGLDAAESVTAVRQMLQALIKPSSQGREALKKYGISLDDVQASLKQKGLLATLLMLRQRFQGNQQDLAKLFMGVEGFNGVLSLTQNGGRQAAGVFAQVGKSAGLTQEAFDQSKTAGFRFRQALAVASDAGIVLANQLAKLVGFFSDNRTALTALMIVVGAVATGWVAYNAAQGVAAAVTQITTGQLWGLNAALEANPALFVVGALAALAVALVIAYQRSATFREIVQAAFHAVGDAAMWLVGVWGTLRDTAVVVFGTVAGTVSAAWGAVRTATTDTWGAIAAVTRAVWGGIVAFLAATWTVIRVPLVVAFTFYREFITSVWNVIRLATLAVWGAIRPYLDAVWGAIRALAVAVFGGIRDSITRDWHLVESATRTVWGVLSAFLTVTWGVIRSGASIAWSGIKTAIISPVGDAVDAIKGLIGHGGKDKAGLVGWLAGAWDTIIGGVSDFGGAVKNAVVGAFKGVVGTILKFAISILQIVGKIPGVDFGGTIKNLQSTGHSLGIQGFAQGGAFARTGGLVTSPITLMGEEAPRHPEFVIPTNPAYRGRAQRLALMAMNAVGLAEGGVVSAFRDAIKVTHAGPKAALALFEAGVVESGLRNLPYGDRDSRGALQVRDSTAKPMGLNNMDPLGVALAFLTRGFFGHGGAISLAASMPTATAGMVAQLVQGSEFPARYDLARGEAAQFLKGGGGGGILGAIGGAISGAAGAVGGLLEKGASFLIGQLPGVGGMPDWLKGLGKEVLDRVGKWITSTVGGLLGGGGGGVAQGPAGVGTFRGVPMADWVIESLQYAERKLHRTLHPTSGYRPGFDPHTATGSSEHQGKQYPHGAVDFGGFHDAAAKAMKLAVVAATADFKYPLLAPIGFVDDGHASGTGHKTGGIYAALAKGGMFAGSPFVGAYKNGGRVPADGFAYVHKGETVTPAGKGGPLVHIEHLEVHDKFDEERLASRLAFLLEPA